MAREDGAIRRVCPHCGSDDAVRLGVCTVCERIVCDRCGNIQHTAHGRRVCHDACLHKDQEGGGFKMIRLIK
ncbi:MAG: hypothetical protein HY876_01570 [Coriobacteriales bacterium]|nr:hypothetical protein [Coriobacteriales bacterium]